MNNKLRQSEVNIDIANLFCKKYWRNPSGWNKNREYNKSDSNEEIKNPGKDE